jgi:hypothetical protein
MMATQDIKAIPAIIDLFCLRQHGVCSTKQSQTVPLHVGHHYLPTQSVISTLQKVKARGIETTIDEQNKSPYGLMVSAIQFIVRSLWME